MICRSGKEAEGGGGGCESDRLLLFISRYRKAVSMQRREGKRVAKKSSEAGSGISLEQRHLQIGSCYQSLKRCKGEKEVCVGVQCFSIKRVRKREGETLGDHDEQIEKEREKERFRQERSGLVVVLKGACHTHTLGWW